MARKRRSQAGVIPGQISTGPGPRGPLSKTEAGPPGVQPQATTSTLSSRGQHGQTAQEGWPRSQSEEVGVRRSSLASLGDQVPGPALQPQSHVTSGKSQRLWACLLVWEKQLRTKSTLRVHLYRLQGTNSHKGLWRVLAAGLPAPGDVGSQAHGLLGAALTAPRGPAHTPQELTWVAQKSSRAH